MNPSAFPADSDIVRFAAYLSKQKEAVLTAWLDRVRADPAIVATDVLNSVAIRNHLPEIFDDLVAALGSYGSDTQVVKATEDAEEHGAARMQQGYELSEMLREIKHLRAVLILHLRLFEEQHPDHRMALRLYISTTLHSFLDQLMIDATEEFLWAKMSLQERVHLGFIR
jgi:Arc/MetJ-type ribon-helix-helix transcriptional regulator